MTRYFITGGAGFIGSTVVDALLLRGHEVAIYDNMNSGQLRFLRDSKPVFIEGDILDKEKLEWAMVEYKPDFIFHMAANADIRFGPQHPTKDLEVNTIGTSNVLEAMRKTGVKKIAFASSSAMYGNTDIVPTPEDIPTPKQTSFYGASKLAGEGLVQSYSEAYNLDYYIFRYVSILGPRYTHGHAYNFYKALKQNPNELYVLGGKDQKKSYLDVEDCVNAMMYAIFDGPPGEIYNIGHTEYFTLKESVNTITSTLNLSPNIIWSGNERGWVGDSVVNILDISKIKSLGWSPKYSIKETVERTITWLSQNEWILDTRDEA